MCIVLSASLAAGQERKITPGDAIEIIVYDNPELSRTVVVSPEGTIDFPFMQGIPIDELTLSRFQEVLITQFSRYLERSPVLTVRFGESYPVKITVLGQVTRPGQYLIPNTSTLQGAIAAAGGFIPGARLSQIKLLRRNGETTSNHIVNLEKFYLEGDPSGLPPLKDGDTIIVTGNPLTSTVKVFGGVQRPGSYEVSFQASLLDIIFMAGGPTDDANLQDVRLASVSAGKSQKVNVNLKELAEQKNSSALPQVSPGDLVYVPKKAVTWKKFIGVLRDLSTFATLYLVILYNR